MVADDSGSEGDVGEYGVPAGPINRDVSHLNILSVGKQQLQDLKGRMIHAPEQMSSFKVTWENTIFKELEKVLKKVGAL